MLKLGNKIISDLYLGDKRIAKAFLGAKLVYEKILGQPIFLDYIEFDGNSWIDTGISYQDCTVECGLTCPTSDRQLMGWASYASTYWGITNSQFELGGGSVLTNSDTTKYSEVKIEVAISDKRYLTLSHNGNSIKRQGNVGSETYNYVIGAVPNTYSCGFIGNLYFHRFISPDGELIQDLRPCLHPKTLKACMYDMVTEKYFYNQGTGTLTAGNKVSFVDYISFDGESWIDVEYIPSSNTRVVGKVSFTQWHPIAGANYIFGVFGNSANFGFNVGSARTILNVPWGNSSGISFSNDNLFGQVYSFDISKNGAYIDGVLKIAKSQLTQEFTATKSFFVGWSNGTSTQKLVGNVYPMQIYENDVLEKDLRPCIINNVAGLYDMVTGKFHTNIGTGTLKASGRFVQSILFDGASFIDTGIAHQTCTVECDIRFEETGTRQLMGFGAGTGQYWGAGASGTFDYMSGTNALDRTLVVLNVDITDITITVNADGVIRKSTKGSQITQLTYRIGGAPTGVASTSYWSTCEVWGNKFTVNGEVVQDLRPYVDEDGIPCFYDMVTNVKFYNKGTGTLSYTE